MSKIKAIDPDRHAARRPDREATRGKTRTEAALEMARLKRFKKLMKRYAGRLEFANDSGSFSVTPRLRGGYSSKASDL